MIIAQEYKMRRIVKRGVDEWVKYNYIPLWMERYRFAFNLRAVIRNGTGE